MGIRSFLAGDLLTSRETSARFHDGAAATTENALYVLHKNAEKTATLC